MVGEVGLDVGARPHPLPPLHGEGGYFDGRFTWGGAQRKLSGCFVLSVEIVSADIEGNEEVAFDQKDDAQIGFDHG